MHGRGERAAISLAASTPTAWLGRATVCHTWCYYYCYYCAAGAAACCATSKQLLKRFAASQFDPHLHAWTYPQLQSCPAAAAAAAAASIRMGLGVNLYWLRTLLIRRVWPPQVRVRKSVRVCVCVRVSLASTLHTSVRANAVDWLPLSVLGSAAEHAAYIFIYNLNAAFP